MEGTQPEAAKLLRKVRELTRSIIVDLSEGRSPLISIHRFRNYCSNRDDYCLCSFDIPKGQEVLTLQKESHVYRINVFLRVLLIIQQLLQENRHGSKRDIYYMHPSVFKAQSVVDRAINDICILLQCSRHNLNVVSVGNGLVMGWLRFQEAGKKFDCINSPNTAYPIPVLVEEVKDIVSVAQYILVVEKESVFQRLANDLFCKTNRCIVITGRGYPDIPTRRFLRLLVEKLSLPVYGLVDCDPYGFDILTTYRFGSMQMAYDAKFLRVSEIQWLGAFPSDSEKYSIPQLCLLPLTEEDKKRTEAMLLRCYLQHEVALWRLELELMLQRGVKFEIEALSVHSLSFLSESCVMKVNRNCDLCRSKVAEVLQSLYGVYSVDFVGENDTVKLNGRVNPNVLLAVLEKYGDHGKVSNLKFDGEVIGGQGLGYGGGLRYYGGSGYCERQGYYGGRDYLHPYELANISKIYPSHPSVENPGHRRSIQHQSQPPPLPPPPAPPLFAYLPLEPPKLPTGPPPYQCCTIL